ncbi:hypothetical protein GGR52DRAFT_496666 [Hypoxylon sp. FL1284]|nr:hypothetical protein GGR52DRAFT_496666 [Hypoxylon sp. FL1284]
MAAESDDWSRPSPIRPRDSQVSLGTGPWRPSSASTSTTHRRAASDNVSLMSQSLAEEIVDFTRHSTALSEPQPWLDLGTDTPAGHSATNPPAHWTEDGDIGSKSLTASPNLTAGAPQSYHASEQFGNSPAPTFQADRPRPAPMQFEEVKTDPYPPPGSSQPMFSPRGRFQHSRTDSRANLLPTPSTTAWRSPRTPPPYSAVMPPPKRRWFRWRPAWFMYLSFLFGICCAIGHHAFYKALDGRPAENQIAMLRYGAVLAFATKAGLVAAIVIAYKQRIWTTVRNKFLSVAALDSLFAATEDFMALLNVEVYRRAKTTMLLAVLVWLTPIVIILTSNTLVVEPALRVDDTRCPGIRSLNFDREGREEWRTPTRVNGITGLSVSLWNKTADESSPDWFDYYTAPSDQFVMLAYSAAYRGRALPKTDANLDICGPGWNCTYTINFTAPAYKCSELASGVGSDIKPLGDQKPPDGFSTKLLIPEGNYSYYAYATGGDYASTQMNDTSPGGILKTPPPFPATLGAFRTEPVVWIGYSVRADSDERGPLNKSMPGWDDAYIPKVMACENYETAYTVDFNLINGQQTTNVTQRKFLRRIIDTNWMQDEEADDGTNDETTASPKNNYVYPRDTYRYRRVAAFHSIGSQLRHFVNGTIDSQAVDKPISNTKAVQTKLLDPMRDYFASADLMGLVQDFYEDMILSFFSNPQFLSVVWAVRPDEASGVGAGDEATMYPCVRSRSENVFRYRERDLWIVYSLAILLALGAVVSGTLAILENEGLLRSTRFSSIVAATRGPALEKLGWAGLESRGDLPPDVKRLKVGYGIVQKPGGLGVLQEDTGYPESMSWDGGDVRYGFGLEGDVRQTKSEASLFRQSARVRYSTGT